MTTLQQERCRAAAAAKWAAIAGRATERWSDTRERLGCKTKAEFVALVAAPGSETEYIERAVAVAQASSANSAAIKRNAPVLAHALRVVTAARCCVGNHQDAAYYGRRTSDRYPKISVGSSRTWRDYSRKVGYYVTEWGCRISAGPTAILMLAAGERIGKVGGLYTCWHDQRTGRACWLTGRAVYVEGYMIESPAGWSHGKTRIEAAANAARLMRKTTATATAPTVATYRLARRCGLCAEGLDNWLQSQGLDRSARLTRADIERLAPGNPYASRVLAVMA